MAAVEGGHAMEADQSGGSSPLSSIGDEQPSSPVPMPQLSSPAQVAQPSSPVQVARPPSPAVAPVEEEIEVDIPEDASPPTPRRSRRNRAVRTDEKGKPAKKVTVKRAPKKRKWDAENMIIDPKSPLASADLRSLLSSPAAWDALDAGDKAEVLALFPDQTHILAPGTEAARPDFGALRNDDTFRHDCATFTEHLSQGRFDPEWLAMAWSAHERRKMGDFDEYLVSKFEDDWEVDLPEDFKPRRGLPLQPGPETKESEGQSRQIADPRDSIGQPMETEEGKEHEEGQQVSKCRDQSLRAGDDHGQLQDKDVLQDVGDMADDELKTEENAPMTHKMSLSRRQSTKMDIDRAESEDELA